MSDGTFPLSRPSKPESTDPGPTKNRYSGSQVVVAQWTRLSDAQSAKYVVVGAPRASGDTSGSSLVGKIEYYEAGGFTELQQSPQRGFIFGEHGRVGGRFGAALAAYPDTPQGVDDMIYVGAPTYTETSGNSAVDGAAAAAAASVDTSSAVHDAATANGCAAAATTGPGCNHHTVRDAAPPATLPAAASAIGDVS